MDRIYVVPHDTGGKSGKHALTETVHVLYGSRYDSDKPLQLLAAQLPIYPMVILETNERENIADAPYLCVYKDRNNLQV